MSISSVSGRASKKSIMSIIIMECCKSQVLELQEDGLETQKEHKSSSLSSPEWIIFYKITVK